mmetsp:Transcript_10978/g.22990  ORF Transcript_10978/g.22990 Transcript_10978/m.22990 type:complete len:339 (+) Transcript_10978:1072-2088(+)
MGTAKLHHALHPLASLAHRVLVVILHQRRQLRQNRLNHRLGVGAHGVGTTHVPLLPGDLPPMIRRDARDHHGRQRLGHGTLDEGMPVVRGMSQHRHSLLQVGDVGGARMGGHFSQGRDGPLLGLEEGGADIEDIVSRLILLVGVVKGTKMAGLSLLLLSLDPPLVLPHHLHQMRHQFPQHRTEFLPHHLGQIREHRVRELVKVGAVDCQPLTRAPHGFGEVRSERLPSHRNGHVTHALEGPSPEGVHPLFVEGHQFRHERRDAADVGGKFLLGGHGGSGQRRDSHLLDGALGGGFEHGGQFANQGIQQGAYALGLKPFAEHLQDVARRRLHRHGGVVQ